MILADKIIALRKKHGWSQEELAEKLNVTRQSVSKWEGAQSTPDLDKIIKLSEIFGVSTDYLLKDDFEEVKEEDKKEQYAYDTQKSNARRVSMQEAEEFLSIKKWSSMKIAFAVFLYIISPAGLVFLGAASEFGMINISENVAGGLGMIGLLAFVAVATAICVYCGSQTKPFLFLDKELLEMENGVSDLVKERQNQFKKSYYRLNIIGVVLCILAVIPVFVVAVFDENKYAQMMAIPTLLTMVGLGVVCFIRAGIPWASMEKLLQEGEYSQEAKARSKKIEPISTIYWLIVTAIFFVYSFCFEGWGKSWIIWPVAGVIYGVIVAIYNIIVNKE